uniref:Uncharacterized protein n=1 Tax=Aegilops tauschii subsp. strangulata TaxID=200361 RepID=A0A452XNB4_AEGTS
MDASSRPLWLRIEPSAMDQAPITHCPLYKKRTYACKQITSSSYSHTHHIKA